MNSKKVIMLSPQGFRALVSSHSTSSRVIPIDATWYMPNSPENASEQFSKERLPNSSFFDLDAIALQQSKYPHMLPTYEVFRSSLAKMGIQKNDKLVVYDRGINFSSPRAAWTLTLFGHESVYLLDNYNLYKEYDYPLDTNVQSQYSDKAQESNYNPSSEDQLKQNYQKQVIEYEELVKIVEDGTLKRDYFLFDARSHERFTGEAAEPRPGLSSGHIPGALNLPFSKLLQENKSFKKKEELIQFFESEFGIDFTKPFPKEKGIIVMCGTGVTAVILRIAIESIIQAEVPIRVYDGSWTEWAQRAPSKFIIKDI